MRHFISRLAPSLITASFRIAATALTFGASVAYATPVYLKPESRFPSGHHPRRYLESKTRGVQFQDWLRVETKDQSYGWLPEDHLLTPLKLAQEATLLEDTPSRNQMDMDALDSRWLKKNSRVSILAVQGSWVKATVLPLKKNAGGDITYIPTAMLRADLHKPLAKAFLPGETRVLVLPGIHARLETLLAPSRYVEILHEKNNWLEIRYGSLGAGWIKRQDAVTLSDLGTSGARPLFDLAPLRSSAMPYADIVRTLPGVTPLKIIAKKSLRWGQAKLGEVGEIWWPMTDENEEDHEVSLRERIATSELFKRHIFDMATSPAIPALKFISAEGVFRTIDGREWSRLPIFQNKNYPIAIAGGGAVFVGPYMSDDHGETFQQWIRWDILVGTLRRISRASPKGLQILEIHPQDVAGRRVRLKLNIGLASPVQVQTYDQGMSWRTIL